MCVHFFNFDHLRIILQSADLFWGTKFRAPSLPLPPLIFSYLQAFIHGFLWWWASSWLIFSLKWRLQSSFFLLHFAAIKLQEAKDSIDEEDPRPTSSTWSYIKILIREYNMRNFVSWHFHHQWGDNFFHMDQQHLSEEHPYDHNENNNLYKKNMLLSFSPYILRDSR